uniref:Uncharacterized protein n=1 Tax=Panagrellus redivivus TaxID=6233 RepID=A0A7E4VIJ6_PANRE
MIHRTLTVIQPTHSMFIGTCIPLTFPPKGVGIEPEVSPEASIAEFPATPTATCLSSITSCLLPSFRFNYLTSSSS